MQSTSTQCFLELNKLQERIKELEAPLSQTEIRRKELNMQIANLDLEITKTRNGYYGRGCSNEGCPNDGLGEGIQRMLAPLEVQRAQLQLELSKL